MKRSAIPVARWCSNRQRLRIWKFSPDRKKEEQVVDSIVLLARRDSWDIGRCDILLKNCQNRLLKELTSGILPVKVYTVQAMRVDEGKDIILELKPIIFSQGTAQNVVAA